MDIKQRVKSMFVAAYKNRLEEHRLNSVLKVNFILDLPLSVQNQTNI
jgi:hypothetical protein